MFVAHSPQKRVTRDSDDCVGAELAPVSQVRKSIGEWETVKSKSKSPNPLTSSKKVTVQVAGPSKSKPALSQESGEQSRIPTTEAMGSPPSKKVYPSLVAEARACLTKAKLFLRASKTMKTESKDGVIIAVDRLYQLVKESEAQRDERGGSQSKKRGGEGEEGPMLVPLPSPHTAPAPAKDDSDLIRSMEEHSRLIRENSEKMEALQITLQNHRVALEGASYASVAAGSGRGKIPEQTTLHSVVVTSKDETESGEEVLDRIRKAVNAKEGGVIVDKIRKAKDRKVIVGCRSDEERQKVKERLKAAGDYLNVEEIQNKDPLLILKDVLTYNSDDDILRAMRNQNERIFRDLDTHEDRVEIRYKKKTRNPLMNHIVIRVSPKLWARMRDVESIQIELQRIHVADQSPLVQCSLCLGYGHGRRFCKETVEKCCHCTGPHKKADCPDWLAGVAPTCSNCVHAKLNQVVHNAFSQDCPIRRKWDALARATTAYC